MKFLHRLLGLGVALGGLASLQALAAGAPHRPLRILHLGPVDAAGSVRGAQARTNYVYLPGQTLAPEAIWFDHVVSPTNLTEAHLAHFDAVVQALPDDALDADRRAWLERFERSGKGRLRFATGPLPPDVELRKAVLAAVPAAARTAWEASLAARPPLRRRAGEVPNYERRPEPVGYQEPLDPADSLRYTQVPADFELSLFAAEPDVVKPVWVAWDERGRAWVVEAKDYPHGLVPEGQPGLADIKVCEDTDGDGRADRFTVFADGLNLATSIVFAGDGVLVSEARHMLFLRDTDGDGKADERRPLLPGWGVGDSHAMQGNLTRGFDNWLYGAVGYSNFRGQVGGKNVEFGQGVFRFRPDGSALEFLHQFNNNTWGFGLNAAGDVFGSTANGNPSFYGYLPAHILNPTQPGFGRGGGGGAGGFRPGYRLDGNNTPEPDTRNVRRLPSAKSLAPGMRMHPNTPNVRMVDNFGGYTAAAGHAFLEGDSVPSRLRGKAMVTEPTAKLVGLVDIRPDGGGYSARDAFNFLASSDEWMSPIFADVGPDGAVWVIDFYSFVIQHNPTPNARSAGVDATTGPGGAYKTANDLRDQSHGRIYRAVWKDAPRKSLAKVDVTKPEEVLAALDDSNPARNLTAQRLAVDRGMTNLVPALRKRVRSGTGGTGAIHALWSLSGLRALDAETHRKALSDRDPAVRRNAIRALPSDESGRQLFFGSPVVQDPDLVTRQAAFVKLLEFPTLPEIRTVVAQLQRVPANTADPFLNDSLTLLGRIHKVSGVGENEVKVAAGDPKRGEALFYDSPTAACAACHMANGRGGAVGPILDGIAVRADKAYILESLMEPNAKFAKGFENLEISPMPPLGAILKEQELADVLAFLATLTQPPKDGITVPVRKTEDFE